jgi:hypothetical protein
MTITKYDAQIESLRRSLRSLSRKKRAHIKRENNRERLMKTQKVLQLMRLHNITLDDVRAAFV